MKTTCDVAKNFFRFTPFLFLEDNMRKNKRIFNVYHVEKTVEPNGKVHLPKKFLDSLDIKARDKVIVALYLGDRTVRIRKMKVVYDVIYTEKNHRSNRESLHTKTFSRQDQY